MAYYVLKVVLSALLVVLVAEAGKRNSVVAGILGSLPLISLLAMFWLYIDTHDVAKISAMSQSIFWFVIPSLALFIALPVMLKKGMHFYPSLGVSIVVTVLCYYGMILGLRRFGIHL